MYCGLLKYHMVQKTKNSDPKWWEKLSERMWTPSALIGNQSEEGVRKWTQSWIGSGMDSRSWTKIVMTGKTRQCLVSSHHGNHCFEQCKWVNFWNRASLKLLLVLQKWSQEDLLIFQTVGYNPLVTHENIKVCSKWGYVFVKPFFWLYMCVCFAIVGSHWFRKLGGYWLSQSLTASNTSY